MTKKSSDAIRRADHALVGVLALFIATVSAAGGAAAVYAPHTEQLAKPAAVQVAAAAAPVAVVPVSEPLTGAPIVIDASNVNPAAITVTQDSAMAELLREHRCLSEVMYYEARGEGVKGQMAIAEVVFHRLAKGIYGHSICNVVFEGAGHRGCQFSFACTHVAVARRPNRAWKQAQYLAAKILVGQARLTNITEGAVNFHAVTVSPVWSSEMERTTQIGNHIFYKSLPRSRPL